MGAKRILLGTILAGLLGGPALGQTSADGLFPSPPPQSDDQSVAPVAGVAGLPAMVTSATGALPQANPSPTNTLAGTPAGQLPPGSYASPWCGGQPAGCAGPWGAHGPVSYELYSNTGVSFPFTGGNMIGILKAGVMTGGGGRSLLFDKSGTSAWVLDLGLSYTHNEGAHTRVIDVYTPPPTLDSAGNTTTPDQVNSYYLRALNRTSFNYGIGRDWWLNGHGNLNETSGPNWRVGAEVGGRWGTAHVDLTPVGDQFGYYRRQATYEGLYLGGHIDCEVPMGGWVLFGGLRGQWGYDWMNIIPPMDGDVQSFNVLLNAGIRF